MIERIIGLDVFTTDGQKYNAKDFINTPRVGDKVIMKDNYFYSEHQGDSGDCVSGVCPIK